eukprot:scaffold8212_cov93-Cylindrotheca_fusiformis.AAC.1
MFWAIKQDDELAFVTEQVAKHTNATLGALLNVTFSNVPRFFYATLALSRRIIASSVLGLVWTIETRTRYPADTRTRYPVGGGWDYASILMLGKRHTRMKSHKVFEMSNSSYMMMRKRTIMKPSVPPGKS